MRIVGAVLFFGLLVFVTMQLSADKEPGRSQGQLQKVPSDTKETRTRVEPSASQGEVGSVPVRSDETSQDVERENPRAREIREALDTPVQNFFASVSPVWVQIRRVLEAHGDEEWVGAVNDIISSIKDARRTIGFEGEYLLRRQNTLMESLWSASFAPALKSDLAAPLQVLGERTERFSSQ